MLELLTLIQLLNIPILSLWGIIKVINLIHWKYYLNQNPFISQVSKHDFTFQIIIAILLFYNTLNIIIICTYFNKKFKYIIYTYMYSFHRCH